MAMERKCAGLRRRNWLPLLALGAGSLLAPGARADVVAIRPIHFGSGVSAAGTLTVNPAGAITDWDLRVTTSEQLAHYTPANSGSKTVDQVSVSSDGAKLSVFTGADPSADGGTLGFRSFNPFADVGVTLADFTGLYGATGAAFYMNGGVFDYLDLAQGPNTDYLAAQAGAAGVFDLMPLSFSGGVTLHGTITTDGTTGVLGPGNITSWDIYADMVTVDVFTPLNSSIQQQLVSWDGSAVLVMNPGGYLQFVKGFAGGDPFLLQLADFSWSPGGQAGYYLGAAASYTVDLGASPGNWNVTGAVPEPSACLLFGAVIAGLALRARRRSNTRRL